MEGEREDGRRRKEQSLLLLAAGPSYFILLYNWYSFYITITAAHRHWTEAVSLTRPLTPRSCGPELALSFCCCFVMMTVGLGWLPHNRSVMVIWPCYCYHHYFFCAHLSPHVIRKWLFLGKHNNSYPDSRPAQICNAYFQLFTWVFCYANLRPCPWWPIRALHSDLRTSSSCTAENQWLKNCQTNIVMLFAVSWKQLDHSI